MAATTTSSVLQAIRRCLLAAGLLSLAACGLGRSEPVPSVTIEMQCVSSLDCPTGFECLQDGEHGPPVRLCESTDPSATCPEGFDTKVMYGQTFCRPPSPIMVSSPRSGPGHRRSAGL
ncbi:MAG TPA: hypothetical protein VIX73_10240 [Kofleriaceae bacterium]